MIALALVMTLAADGAGYFPLPKGLKVKPEAIAPKPFDLTIKKPEKVSLPNGLKIYFVEDHAAPLVNVRALCRLGGHDDPTTKLGLADLLFDTLTSGGAGERNADQLDELLEQQAADLFGSAGDEFSSVGLSLRAEDTDKLMPVFADVLMRPRFQADRFDVAVNRQLENLRRRPDRPEGLASRALAKAVFGATSLLGRESTPLTLKSVKVEELKTLHARTFGPQSVALLVTGDFDRAKVLEKLTALFGGWKGGEVLKRDYGAEPKLERRIIFVPKQTAQVKIRIGGFGYRRLDPAEYPMRLVSTALGSFGVGRLYKEIRDERGLAYSAYAYSGSGPTTGMFVAGFDSKPETAIEAIEVALPILEAKDAAISKAELATAADMAVNSFAFRFDSASKIAWERAVLDLFGYPDDYLDKLRDNIARVDEASAKTARAAMAQGGAFQIIVVGPKEKLAAGLARLGPVTEITDVESWK
ncbi:MAG: insulinase family protein [Archangiaceae bacterium]|nr:insulinase family protein [Archangiaceae bacterium]